MYLCLLDLICCMENFAQEIYLNIHTGEYKSISSLDETEISSFIPIPKVSSDEIVLSFLERLNDKKAKRYFANKSNDKEFHGVFHRYINDNGLYDDYTLFHRNAILEVAKDWCYSNGIQFTSKKRT